MRTVIGYALSDPTGFDHLRRVAFSTQDLLTITQSGGYQKLAMKNDFTCTKQT
jgi:hypothetical protein